MRLVSFSPPKSPCSTWVRFASRITWWSSNQRKRGRGFEVPENNIKFKFITLCFFVFLIGPQSLFIPIQDLMILIHKEKKVPEQRLIIKIIPVYKNKVNTKVI
jgi:hypothetical protein